MSDQPPSTTTAVVNQTAENLKVQGNQLHQQGQFRAAYEKYSEAIKEDPTNAVYFANRAATCLALKEYLDAASDALKATELDPKYAKAWSRHATACFNLGSPKRSIDSWKKALSCLPSDAQATETDKRLRSQFTAGLKKSEDAAATSMVIKMDRGATADQTAWFKAQLMEESLKRVGKMSSAFVILEAYRSFKQGVDAMKQLQQKKLNGQLAWHGRQGALELICNGVMEDPRVFHVDCTDWMEKYNNQVIFEAQMHRAWKEGGTNVVKKEAVERLKKEGWDKTRPALATTVRAWIMCGFQATTFGNNKLALEYYTRAEEVIKWGSALWPNVPASDRGVIFEKTFLRGVSRMRLNAMHKYLAEGKKECPITFDQIIDYSKEIIAEIEADAPSADAPMDISPATFGSFYQYPRAEAYSILGWCYTQLGLAAKKREDAQDFFTKSFASYIVAGDGLPLDDENAAVYFKAAVETHWWMPEPPCVMINLGIISRVQQSFELYPKIWKHSPISNDRDPQIAHAIGFALDCFAALAQHKIVGDDIVKPKEVRRKDKWAGPEVVYL